MTGRTDPDPHGTLMSTPDPELDRIRRAFDAAFQRMRVASTVGDHEDELSNLLQHLYKLGELVRKRRGLTRDGLKQFLHDSADPDLRAGGAAMWADRLVEAADADR
jgi:hypothetical protein